jgi:hypothetical protein
LVKLTEIRIYGGWFDTLLCVVLSLATSRQSAKRCVFWTRLVILSLTMHTKRRVLCGVLWRCHIVAWLKSKDWLISQATGRHRIDAPLDNASFGVLR